MPTQTFKSLCKKTNELSSSETFENASLALEEYIFAIAKNDFVPLIAEIGAIPESIAHDSTEEKLYAKATDIMLAKCLRELGLKAVVLKERANSADVYAESKYHGYSLVADAKAFRLSRTAKNQKDFKVESMAHWKGDNDYSVLCCPYFQYPSKTSQIFGQALDRNISLFSWEYFSVLLQNGITETEETNISALWNISGLIAKDTSVSEKNKSFISKQDEYIRSFVHLGENVFENYFSKFKSAIIKRGETEIDFWKSRIEEIKSYSKEQAISELLSALKLNEKINAIKKFVAYLEEASPCL